MQLGAPEERMSVNKTTTAVCEPHGGGVPEKFLSPAAGTPASTGSWMPGWKTVAAVVGACAVMVAVFGFYAFFAREVTHWMEGEHHWFHDFETCSASMQCWVVEMSK